MHMNEREKMLIGEKYNPLDVELVALRLAAKTLAFQYNQTSPNGAKERLSILKSLFGSCTENTFVEPTFQCDYGFNIHTEGLLIVNHNCVFLDVCEINLGKNVFIGPNTIITTACHPIDPQERLQVSFGKPIFIGDNVWIGANCTILAGVKIGSSSVIGAGSVVTKDVPNNTVAYGTPCKAINTI